MEQPGMGLDLAAHSRHAARLLDHASEVSGVDLGLVLKQGGPELERTAVLQPALTAVSLGVFEALTSSGCWPGYVAGHSLGEVAAWSAAGGTRPTAAIGLAAVRGQLMEREARRHPGGMLAVHGTREDMAEALAVARRLGGVNLAAHNSPEQWVLSGDPDALSPLLEEFPSVMLRVAGAWHSPHMTGAVQELRSAVTAAGSPEPPMGFVCNQTGSLAPRGAMTDLLAGQLTRPVRWADTMSTLARRGVTDFVTVGPGRVLRGLVRKNLGKEARVHATDSPEELACTIEQLGQAAAAAEAVPARRAGALVR